MPVDGLNRRDMHSSNISSNNLDLASLGAHYIKPVNGDNYFEELDLIQALSRIVSGSGIRDIPMTTGYSDDDRFLTLA